MLARTYKRTNAGTRKNRFRLGQAKLTQSFAFRISLNFISFVQYINTYKAKGYDLYKHYTNGIQKEVRRLIQICIPHMFNS